MWEHIRYDQMAVDILHLTVLYRQKQGTSRGCRHTLRIFVLYFSMTMAELEIRFWSLSRDLYTMWEHIGHGQMVVQNTVLYSILYCRYVYCCVSNLVVEIRTYLGYYTTVCPWELENLCSSLFKRPFLGVVICRADAVALISEDPFE